MSAELDLVKYGYIERSRPPFRVVLRAFTCRRDAMIAETLAALLRRAGCQVIVTGVRNFNTAVRMWQPDVVVVNTPGEAHPAKVLAPKAKLVFLDGEGYQTDTGGRAKWWAERRDLFDVFDLVMVWGEASRDSFREHMDDVNMDMIHAIGNPKLDMVRYLPESVKKTSGDKSIGFVCRFASINHHEGLPTICRLNEEIDLPYVRQMCSAYWGMYRSMEAVLQNTNLNIEIRPHPNEAIETYEEWVKPRLGKEHSDRIRIDKSLDLAGWAVRQKALVSPTSTSFLESYLLGIPVVNIDRIAGTVDFNRDYASVTKEWQGSAMMPGDTDELCALLQSEIPAPLRDDQIEEQLAEHCNWDRGGSTIKRAADLILGTLTTVEGGKTAHWPKVLVDLRDEISFRRAMKKNRFHANFNYKAGFHALPEYFDDVVDNILRASGTTSADRT